MTPFAKTLATVAATAALAVGAALAGAAPAAAATQLQTEVSDTWKPGFQRDDDGRYVRHMVVPRDTAPRQVTRIETRDAWAPGFQSTGDGDFQRLVPHSQNGQGSATISKRDTWAPGYRNDMGDYVRVVPNGGPSQSASLPAEAN
ncbi:hypothetical protein C882_1874 [Caenispirillum salinarum AK4]|uniref:Uncharacterized protein n=1 Tax=Caenispirillum salinarum AK4 TaxID=1238182 RepID=K9GQC1_9PROT|nr:hypothetical protein [Caenispirillum salinarum]EKV27372.1 hypothetical protein C882_1874 [Caenispirillum salinarum AK4]